jgi:ribosomal protein L11 methyltransferase
MKSWPALEITSPTDLLQAALVDFQVAAIDDNAPDIWRVFFHTAEERDRARALLAPDFPGLTFAPLDVPDEDWAARSQANLHAIQVGRIVVAPPWDIVVRIQPSMGFGTGHHATTRLCLRALQELDPRGRSAVDVGTGSGVLAIAASLLGASPVLAIDDDPDAIQSARENADLNPGATVDIRVVDLRTASLDAYDIVLANLTGGLLMQAAESLWDLAQPSGHLILSGFMATEEAAVLAALKRGRTPLYRAQEEEWVCVTLQR